MEEQIQPIDVDHKKRFIRNQACFAQLNDDETAELANMLKEKQVLAGEVIVREGENVDSVYLIVSGKADVQKNYVQDSKMLSKSVANLIAGDAIGLNETGFFSLSGRRTATVIALTNMVLLQLSVAAFHGFSLANSRVNRIMRQQANKLLDDPTSSTKVSEKN